MTRLLVLALIATGCASSPRQRTRYILSGTAIVAGVVDLAFVGPEHQCAPGSRLSFCDSGDRMRSGQIVVGVAALIAGLAGLAVTAQPETPQPSLREPPTVIPDVASIRAPATDDPTLRQLTAQATLAARAGQCSAVRMIGDRIARIDRSYRRSGFLADPSIARCM